ncbi:MAG: NnrS family protein [Nitrospirae bacterium]|nr:NnrS family protein [Nitrospirota bacterium]MBI3351336.1 NnrS family protein [Nitrospirota bacterium]
MPVTIKFFFGTWKTLGSAPHRLFFLGGACQGIAAMLWWLLDLSGRFRGFYPFFFWTIPPVWAHAYLMIYGFFPFFIFGFLFTFFPNWLDAEKIPSWHYLITFFAIGTGTVLFYTGLLFSKNILLLSVLSLLSGWGIGAFSLFRILLQARSPEKIHLSLMALFVVSGAVGVLSFFLWLFMNNLFWLNVARVVGIWLSRFFPMLF